MIFNPKNHEPKILFKKIIKTTKLFKEEEVFIKAGEPLCYYVPFKREESKLVIDNNYDKYKSQIEGSMHRALSKFKNGYRRFNK